MKYEVSIDSHLFEVFPEIRLGLLSFHADIKAPDADLWSYMNDKVLPKIRADIEGREWE